MKKLIWFVGLLSLVVVAGCSSNSNSSNSGDNAKTTTTEVATAYQKLSSSNKKDIKFKTIKSETDENDSYSLSLKIKNNSNKSVKFDKSKFSLNVDGVKKFSSSADGTVTLKAGQEKTLVDVFQNVSEDKLDGDKVQIVYLNKDNVVASPKLDTDSDEDSQENTSATSSQQSTDSNADGSSTANSSSNAGSSDTSSRFVTDTQMAVNGWRKAHGDWTGENITATDTGSGYRIDKDGSQIAFMDYDGNMTESNGNYSKGSEIFNPNVG